MYKAARDSDSSDTPSNSGKKDKGDTDDIADSYIKQYYARKYGSTKKGFNPV
jgi:hypothetical protein